MVAKPAAVLFAVVAMSAGFAASAAAAVPPDVSASVARVGVCSPFLVVQWTVPDVTPPVQNVNIAYNVETASPLPQAGARWLNFRPDVTSASTIEVAQRSPVWLYVRATNADGAGVWRLVSDLAPMAAGDGVACPVANDAPGDAVGVIADFALENAPVIRVMLGALFLVALTFWLVRRGLMKARGATRC